jgi:hypothetical protein
MVFDVGNPPPQINEKTLKGMTKQDWYLYGRWNQNARRRYQVDKPERVEELPRFRSQVEKERARAGEEETLEKVVGRFEGGEGGVPNYYKEVEIKYSKFGVEDFDFGYVQGSGKANLAFTIQLHSAAWRLTLRTLMRIVYSRCTILHRQYGYMLLLTRLRHVEFRFAHYVNLGFCSRI